MLSLVCFILYILEDINAISVFCILYALKDNSASLVCCILYILEDINARSVFCILYGLYRKLSSHLISETNSFRRVWNIQCPSLGTQWLNISKVWGGGHSFKYIQSLGAQWFKIFQNLEAKSVYISKFLEHNGYRHSRFVDRGVEVEEIQFF